MRQCSGFRLPSWKCSSGARRTWRAYFENYQRSNFSRTAVAVDDGFLNRKPASMKGTRAISRLLWSAKSIMVKLAATCGTAARVASKPCQSRTQKQKLVNQITAVNYDQSINQYSTHGQSDPHRHGFVIFILQSPHCSWPHLGHFQCNFRRGDSLLSDSQSTNSPLTSPTSSIFIETVTSFCPNDFAVS